MRAKARAGLLVLASLPGLLAMPGCYLGHVAAGQLRLLAARRPIDAVIADPATPEDLRERLALAPQARELARDLGLEVQAKRLTRDDIYIADEAFFTGTAAEVTPIRELDSRQIGAGKRGPITEKLQSMFFDVVNGRNPKHASWLSPV